MCSSSYFLTFKINSLKIFTFYSEQFSRVLTLANAVTAIESSTIARANEIIAENRAWTNAYRSNIDTWVADFHKSRNEQQTEAPTQAPTAAPTDAPTDSPTDDPSSSSTVVTLSALLMTVLIAVHLL